MGTLGDTWGGFRGHLGTLGDTWGGFREPTPRDTALLVKTWGHLGWVYGTLGDTWHLGTLGVGLGDTWDTCIHLHDGFRGHLGTLGDTWVRPREPTPRDTAF